MKSSFLLEIGTEDLPARFISPAMRQLEEHTSRILGEVNMSFSEVRTYGTPRRLAVVTGGLPRMQSDRVREVFGPSRKAAFDEEGRPTKAAIGFARSQKVNVENLVIKAKDKGEYVVAVLEEKGCPVGEILPEVLKRIVLSLHFPKSMRWGNGDLRFARPIRWLLALLDDEPIAFEVDGIRSGSTTMGHRFLSPAAFKLSKISGYQSLLANNFVIVEPEERQRLIAERMEALLLPFGEKAVQDPELIETVVNLVEYPVPVLATFPSDYLSLPRELLITVMKGHQKYFAVEDHHGSITNHFVVVGNTSAENADTVRVGAERVIKARFDDARFYFEEDRKVSLERKTEELRKVTFHERIGSLLDKTDRIVALAEYLSERIPPVQGKHLVRAARISKADLITGVVREFPELQGIMGKYYALQDGEAAEVAQALKEQYMPASSGGELPRSEIGALLSIADKIDTIAAFFSVGIMPTGSEDPFALRRQALGIIAIMLERRIDVPLHDLVRRALGAFGRIENPEAVTVQVLRFFESRLETVFADFGYRTDMIQSVLPVALHIPLFDVRARLEALKRLQDFPYSWEFLAAMKRISNILPSGAVQPLRPELLEEEAEKTLKARLDSLKGELSQVMHERRYDDAVTLFSSLTDAVNLFFDRVLVMDKREEIKQNRIALLQDVWETVSTLADFSKLSLP